MVDARIRALLIIHDMRSGGAERLINYLIWHLDPGIFDVHLALHRTEIVYPLPPELKIYDLGLKHPSQFLSATRRLRALIRKLDPDLLLAGALNPTLLGAAAMAGSARRTRCVSMVVSNPEKDPGWRQPWARRSYRAFDHFICLCGEMRRIFLKIYPFVAPERVHVWNGPVDVAGVLRQAKSETDEAGSHRARLIAVGRLSRQKRFDILLESLKLIRDQHDVDLLIMGEGSMRNRLEHQARILGVSDSLFMPGFSGNPFPSIAAATVCLLSSDFEGLPNALMEGQALGIPAVSTDCPTGPSDIVIDGRTGFLVAPSDPEALARRTCELLADAGMVRSMGANARKRMREQFDVTVCVPKLGALLQRILNA